MLKLERTSQDIPDISIVCITYNQGNYISQALHGFINQKINVNYEIIIHDDASTDETVDILIKFYHEHPDKVTLLLQKENQYQKQEFEILWYAMSFSSGRYIAVCEGDDYWIDNRKLSKQFDCLECNKIISGCFHSAYTENSEGERILFSNHSNDFCIFSPEKVILGDGVFTPTASLFFRRDILDYMDDDLIKEIPCGDYFIQILSAMTGGLGYFPEPMSVYRIEQENSFSSTFFKVDCKKKATFYKRMCNAIIIIDQKTEGKYHSVLSSMICRHRRTYKKHMKKARKEKLLSGLKSIFRW